MVIYFKAAFMLISLIYQPILSFITLYLFLSLIEANTKIYLLYEIVLFFLINLEPHRNNNTFIIIEC